MENAICCGLDPSPMCCIRLEKKPIEGEQGIRCTPVVTKLLDQIKEAKYYCLFGLDILLPNPEGSSTRPDCPRDGGGVICTRFWPQTWSEPMNFILLKKLGNSYGLNLCY